MAIMMHHSLAGVGKAVSAARSSERSISCGSGRLVSAPRRPCVRVRFQPDDDQQEPESGRRRRPFWQLPSPRRTTFKATDRALELLQQALQSWQRVDNKGEVLMATIATALLLWISNSVLDAIDPVPLLPSALQLVGLGYTFWFTWRYLLFAAGRCELARDVDALRRGITEFDLKSIGEEVGSGLERGREGAQAGLQEARQAVQQAAEEASDETNEDEQPRSSNGSTNGSVEDSQAAPMSSAVVPEQDEDRPLEGPHTLGEELQALKDKAED